MAALGACQDPRGSKRKAAPHVPATMDRQLSSQLIYTATNRKIQDGSHAAANCTGMQCKERACSISIVASDTKGIAGSLGTLTLQEENPVEQLPDRSSVATSAYLVANFAQDRSAAPSEKNALRFAYVPLRVVLADKFGHFKGGGVTMPRCQLLFRTPGARPRVPGLTQHQAPCPGSPLGHGPQQHGTRGAAGWGQAARCATAEEAPPQPWMRSSEADRRATPAGDVDVLVTWCDE